MRITPQLLLKAYASGVFPMARDREEDAVYWVQPDERGILPLDAVHVPRSLKKVIRRGAFEVTTDMAFHQVIGLCAAPAPGRDQTWINHEIETLFCALHASGMAHSVEVWREGRLVGGLYGLALGGAFFGESMFSRATDASKVALITLCALLIEGGFVLLDTQFLTEHLARFGALEVGRDSYQQLLGQALGEEATWQAAPCAGHVLDIVARGPVNPLPVSA